MTAPFGTVPLTDEVRLAGAALMCAGESGGSVPWTPADLAGKDRLGVEETGAVLALAESSGAVPLTDEAGLAGAALMCAGEFGGSVAWMLADLDGKGRPGAEETGVAMALWSGSAND
ncbi:hypothetical protein DP939_36845 [Spongiactinospora rosea]|uniref:Uncharacterized protein n=1 Tax=Spongiactinospora rosea TaxID=2248750 RepID=A0A366LMP2_9ACTN|nr:hypothetical protein [Spongiactinospora rosea]RBQ15176.1 hypothetical protein DP939_36845 [Spongiactinospora rosea]